MEIFTPKNEQIGRVTHLAISAHQDDIEFMAYHGILQCFMKQDKRFGAVVVTNGSGSPRNGLYADCSDEDMMRIRKEEQLKAASVGDYAMQAFMNMSSAEIKNPSETETVTAFKDIISKTSPKIIYTHNLADKHETHVAVTVKLIKALREMKYIPEEFYGCEVWRGLDWMCDNEKVKMNVSGRGNLEASLLGVFDSQISGGKRYDSAVIGRRHANATFSESHSVDNVEGVIYAMDLLPLLKTPDIDIEDYVCGYIDRFKRDVRQKISMFKEL